MNRYFLSDKDYEFIRTLKQKGKYDFKGMHRDSVELRITIALIFIFYDHHRILSSEMNVFWCKNPVFSDESWRYWYLGRHNSLI